MTPTSALPYPQHGRSSLFLAITRILERLFLLFTAIFVARPRHSRRMQTTYAVLEAYSTLSVEEITRPLSRSDFRQQVLPSSLGMPVRDRDAFTKHATGVTSDLETFRMEPQQVFEDEVRNATVVYAKMVGTLTQGRGDWVNECVLMFTFNDQGTEVVQLSEFVDSKKALEMRERIAPKNFDKA